MAKFGASFSAVNTKFGLILKLALVLDPPAKLEHYVFAVFLIAVCPKAKAR